MNRNLSDCHFYFHTPRSIHDNNVWGNGLDGQTSVAATVSLFDTPKKAIETMLAFWSSKHRIRVTKLVCDNGDAVLLQCIEKQYALPSHSKNNSAISSHAARSYDEFATVC